MDQVASPPEPTVATTGCPGGGVENENEAASGYTSQDTGPGGLTPGHSGSATPAGFERSSFASGRPQTATPDTSPTKGRKGVSLLSSSCANVVQAAQSGFLLAEPVGNHGCKLNRRMPPRSAAVERTSPTPAAMHGEALIQCTQPCSRYTGEPVQFERPPEERPAAGEQQRGPVAGAFLGAAFAPERQPRAALPTGPVGVWPAAALVVRRWQVCCHAMAT